MIIVRYLKKEIFSTLLAVTTLLLMVFVFQQFISYMRSAAIGRLTVHTVSLLVSLQVPVLLTMLLPLSLFLGILIALSRFYADNEMTILFVSGISRKRLFIIVSEFALFVVLIVAVLALWIAPHLEDYSTRIFERDEASALQLLQPGRFSDIANDKWVFYVSDVADQGRILKNVFAAELPTFAGRDGKVPSWGVLVAKSGHQKIDDKTGQPFLILSSGNRYAGMPGQKDYKRATFKEYGIRLEQKVAAGQAKENAISTKELLKNLDQKVYVAEFNWRVAMPIMAMVLTLLALALSRVKPRRGRFAKMAPAILIYIMYVNLLFLARAWLVKGMVPAVLGFWWVHVLMLGLALFLLVQQGWEWQVRKIVRKV